MLQIGLIATGDSARIRRLEQLDIDALWVGGHVASPNPTPEAMVSLARLSAITERVRIGTAILLLPLYPPAVVAKQLADLDNASGGRITVGVGVGGEYPQEFRACAIPLVERGARMNEAIPLLRELWRAEALTHEGRFFAMHDVRIHPAPRQPGGPPIVVAGRRPPAMRRAATMGDGWMPYLYSPQRYAASVATIRELAAEQGRSLMGFGWHAFVFTNVDPDGDRAREQAARVIGGTYRQDIGPLVDKVAAAGTAEEVGRKLVDFVRAGVRSFIFHAAAAPDEADGVIRRLLDEVVPHVRAQAAALDAGDD